MGTRAASACLLVLGTFIAVASFLPEERLWGVNHLAFFPVPVRVFVLLVLALAFVPRVSAFVHAGLVRGLTRLRDNKPLRRFVVCAVFFGSIATFYACRSSTRLLGDGDVVSNAFEVSYRGDSTSVLPTVQEIWSEDRISPGTTTLYYFLEVVHTRLLDGIPGTAVALFNCVLGGCFVFIVVGAALARSITPALGLWMIALAFASGTMQLFFGYVENYTPLFVIGVLYVISSLRVLHARASIWMPVVFFVVAVLLHVSGVLLGASLTWLIAWRLLAQRRDRLAYSLTLPLAFVTAALAYIVGHTTLAEYFLPMVSTGSRYGALSVPHGVDVANELFLLVPVLPLFIVMGVALWRHRASRPRPPREAARGSLPSGGRDPHWLTSPAEWHFVALVVVPGVLYLLFFNPVIGLARDWDLFSVLVWGLVPLCLLVVNATLASGPVSHTVTIPAAVMGVVLTAAWVGVNASPQRSVDRFESILFYQENRMDYAYEILAKTYYEQGRLADAIRTQETTSAISQNPRHFLTLARYYREYGDPDAAFEVLQKTVEKHPRFRPARRELVVALFHRERFADAITVAQRGIQGNPEDPFYYYYMGRSLVQLGRVDEARSALLDAQRLRSDPILEEAIADELRRIESGN